ncbi:MAG TPA: M28 family peptidase [Geobacteraceae bacterium]|nr:M28 family peptidase [Geobacteraceae bacterium]
MTTIADCTIKELEPPLTGEETALEDRLRRHVAFMADTIGERTTFFPRGLRQAREYVGKHFETAGFTVLEQSYEADAQRVSNVCVEVAGSSRPDEIVVVGAHYDSPLNSPGADDNASGVAALLELARHFAQSSPVRTLRLVAFVNEEPPFFQTELMGSRVCAREAKAKGEHVVAMLALESLGCYYHVPGSQRYPFPFGFFYPDIGDFIGFIANFRSSFLLRKVLGAFRASTLFPSQGIISPEFITGIGWSDHWSFWKEGYPAIMITDTAPFRNPNYHRLSDTSDLLDYSRMARVTTGLTQVIKALTA